MKEAQGGLLVSPEFPESYTEVVTVRVEGDDLVFNFANGDERSLLRSRLDRYDATRLVLGENTPPITYGPVRNMKLQWEEAKVERGWLYVPTDSTDIPTILIPGYEIRTRTNEDYHIFASKVFEDLELETRPLYVDIFKTFLESKSVEPDVVANESGIPQDEILAALRGETPYPEIMRLALKILEVHPEWREGFWELNRIKSEEWHQKHTQESEND